MAIFLEMRASTALLIFALAILSLCSTVRAESGADSAGAVIGYVVAFFFLMALMCFIIISCITLAPFILAGLATIFLVMAFIALLPFLILCAPCICCILVVYFVFVRNGK